MPGTYTHPVYEYRPSPEQLAGELRHHAVAIVGAGPVGLSAALDLAQRGVEVLVLDDNNTVSIGSRAVCYAKRTLEILDRLGVADRVVERGSSWNVGKVFRRDRLAYEFELVPEPHHKMPGMVNLQQYYLEEWLVDAVNAQPRADLRWKHRVTGVRQDEECVTLEVETPDGSFSLTADYVIACDGSNSDMRGFVGAPFEGQAFMDRFLIADVKMKADFPTERWFWFDPPFHPEQSTLLHRQADNVWRIDFQLGWDTDPEEEKKPERVIPRVRAMLGEDVDFDLEWVSVYQFKCRRIDRFRYGRVLFAGDAAHQVSPFGARGANSGIQDVDNLAWKLAAVLSGQAPEALLDSYHEERSLAADDNIRNSTRSTDFMTPKSSASRALRDAVLELAEEHAFARPFVNSGRLSTPTPYYGCRTVGVRRGEGPQPGDPCPDAPVVLNGGAGGWLLNELPPGFSLLVFGVEPAMRQLELGGLSLPVLRAGADFTDPESLVAERFRARGGAVLLLRPDQYIAGRWDHWAPDEVELALNRALCREAH